MRTETFVETLAKRRVSAILRCFDTEMAAAAMERAIAGGFEIIEFTLSIPGALDLIGDFSRRDGLIVGAGTVLTAAEAEAAIGAGADFLVSPVVDEAVIEVASGAGIASIPGACTPTEMMRAHHAGAPLIKLFPAPAAGPVWLSSVLGPLPFLKVVPTNGVDVDNLSDWLEAGAYGAGFAATLFPTQDLTPAGLDRIEARAHAIVSQICAPAVVDRAIADVG
ncbi:MAG: 2-dehydro-3-deoxyphosphogluconate aldolase [Acidobacteriota bacterium]|nr:2-dehydro-3-deoxyphosphogluconate aldolase [Acidobacteriota bacterium]